MSPTASDQPSIETNILYSISSDEIPKQFQGGLTSVALMFTLYGVFVLLWGASIYALAQKWLKSRSHGIKVLVLSVALLALFVSTTVETVFMFHGVAKVLFAQAHGPKTALQVSCCVPTAALTINILFGDAIVCWRAYVLWKGNRSLLCVCILLLMTTFALGIVDTEYACKAGSSHSTTGWKPDPHADGLGELYEGFSYGVAATVLSLCTNLFATAAVAVKTWQSRKVVKQYIVTPGPRVSQMQRVLTFLVDSGMVYCTLWALVLVWQAGKYKGAPSRWGDNSFWDVFSIFIDGALVPLIGIYPTVIIVVIALNRSYAENGFVKASLDGSVYPLPLHPLAVSVNTTVVTRCDSQPRSRSETVLVIGQKDSAEEGSSTHTIEGRISKDIA